MHTPSFTPSLLFVHNTPLGLGAPLMVWAGPRALTTLEDARRDAERIARACTRTSIPWAFSAPPNALGRTPDTLRPTLEILTQIGAEFDCPIVGQIAVPLHVDWGMDMLDIMVLDAQAQADEALVAQVADSGKLVVLDGAQGHDTQPCTTALHKAGNAQVLAQMPAPGPDAHSALPVVLGIDPACLLDASRPLPLKAAGSSVALHLHTYPDGLGPHLERLVGRIEGIRARARSPH